MNKIQLLDIQLPTNQKFGFFISFLLFLASVFCVYQDEKFIAIFFVFTVIILLAISIWIPQCLLPLNKLWMQFGFVLGMIVSPIVLGIIFFGLFTPIATLMRLSGRDELRLKFNQKTSHWISRNEPINSASFKYQF